MDVEPIQDLLTSIQSLLSAFQCNQTGALWTELQEKALHLTRALEKPRETILKLAFSPTILMAIKVAIDLDIFHVLAKATSSVTAHEIAASASADSFLVERVMRVLVANGFVKEPTPCKYPPTSLSEEMTQRTSVGVVESLFLEMLPAIQKTPEYLQVIGYRNPDDPMFAPLQYTNNMKQDGFSWLCQRPAALARFNAFMEGQRAHRAHWADWFPVRDQILDTTKKCADHPLLVEVGGGRGHDLLGFKERFANEPGKVILEDLPKVIEEARAMSDLDTAGIQTISYDFFANEQPVKGARVYYFRNIFHDWSDDKARIILQTLVKAMEPGHSKILMEEYILPDQNARSLETMTDIAVMVFCSGLERTRQRWANLLESVGLKVNKFWTREGDGQGIIEAELAGF